MSGLTSRSARLTDLCEPLLELVNELGSDVVEVSADDLGDEGRMKGFVSDLCHLETRLWGDQDCGK